MFSILDVVIVLGRAALVHPAIRQTRDVNSQLGQSAEQKGFIS